MFSPKELTQASPQMEQPDAIKTQLKPHQMAVLYAGRDREDNRELEVKRDLNTYSLNSNIGILCDKVGSGKTLEMLSIIGAKPGLEVYSSSNHKRITAELNLCIRHNKPNTFIATNIIVVPHTIFKQWSQTIKTNTTLTCLELFNKKTLTKFQDDCKEGLKHDILLISSTQYRNFYDIYEKFEVEFERTTNTNLILSRIVFDEANMINIKRLTPPKCSFSWFMTSSSASLYYPHGRRFIRDSDDNVSEWHPRYTDIVRYPSPNIYINGIQNTGYIRDTFASISLITGKYHYDKDLEFMNDYNFHIYIKNADSFIEESFTLEPPNVTNFILENPIIYNMLTNIVDPQIISMINGGDIDSAIEQLNCNKTTDENLIKSVTASLEAKLHNLNVKRHMNESLLNISEEQKLATLEKIDVSIREVKHKIKVLIDRVNENDMCAICYDTITSQTIVNCCHNSFCFPCLTTWLSQSNKCPHCRKCITANDLTVVTEAVSEKEIECTHKPLTKLEKLKELMLERLKENPKTKFLIFSEYSNIFLQISRLLEEMSVKFRIVKGQVNKTIRDYKEGDLNCLLLNTNHFGNGLNLENTDDIILLHSLNKEMNHQVIGRAQRPGRKTTLNIWNLKYKNEC